MKKIALVTIVLLLSYLKPYCQDSLFVGKSFTCIGTYKTDGTFSVRACQKLVTFEFYGQGKGVMYNKDLKGNVGNSTTFTWLLDKNKIIILSENNPKDVSTFKFLNPWLMQTIEEDGEVNLFIKKV